MVGKAERHSVGCRQLTGDTLVPQKIGTIGADIDDQTLIVDRQRVEQPHTWRCVGVELPDAIVILAQPQLAGGAEHPLGGLAPEFALLDSNAARERGTHGSEGILLAGFDVGCAADDVAPLFCPLIHQADSQPVRVWVRPHLLDQSDEHVFQTAMNRLDRIHGRTEHRQPLGQILGLELPAKKLFQPAKRDVHWPFLAVDTLGSAMLPISVARHELVQEAHVAVVEETDVGNAVAQHRDSMRTHPEGPPGVPLGVHPGVLEDSRVHHATTENFHPSGPLAGGTAAAVAELALDVHLREGSVKGKNDGRKRTLVSAVKKWCAK